MVRLVEALVAGSTKKIGTAAVTRVLLISGRSERGVKESDVINQTNQQKKSVSLLDEEKHGWGVARPYHPFLFS